STLMPPEARSLPDPRLRTTRGAQLPEGPNNVEIAHHLHEHGEHHAETSTLRERVLEIAEAFLLAVVAISTAYSGYQSAKWDARSAESYAESSRYRVESTQATTTGGQQLLFDATTFNSWLAAHAEGNEKVAALYVRRFTPP